MKEFLALRIGLPIAGGAALVLVLGAAAYGYYRFDVLEQEFSQTKVLLASTTEHFEGKVATLVGENRVLSDALLTEQRKNDFFAEEIRKIAGTVGVLEKLSKTDPELLQKYSKVYFLNEHYTPERLSLMDGKWSANPAREQWIHAAIASRLESLLLAAEANATPLRIVSAFRSFDEQSSLKNAYTVSYGSGANRFSADQGYSEHQLGTTVDLTTEALAPSFADFEETKGYAWLLENAHRYGFVLSYPKGNSYYIYEPWHWRFVGISLATKLHAGGKNFYDLDQREIDSHLVSLFD